MYDAQTATVMTDVECERFEIWPGNEAGRPIELAIVSKLLTVG